MRLIDADALLQRAVSHGWSTPKWVSDIVIDDAPTIEAEPIPDGGIGEMSDGYHTFNGLYYQRMILFATLVKAYKDKAWKSWKHEDGELCFGGGWFIVGIDTPQGSYTYHYEAKDWDLFDCISLPVGKHWDGHTEEDVTRLLSLSIEAEPIKHGRWIYEGHTGEPSEPFYSCSVCQYVNYKASKFCPNCGAKMDK